ncbi:phosphoglycerate kinase [Mailhella sp.]|uniref:phosphoglycerate kinase n=1 Tax=Mailhella sp. TaxID=1981029 RepID=UPI003AB300CE
MKFGIPTIDDFDVCGKTVLCRVDINEPLNKNTGQLKDTTRIDASMATITELLNKNAKVVIMAHQGSDIEYANYYSLRPHFQYLSTKIPELQYIDDVCGPAAMEKMRQLRPGQALLLDNVRFMAEEQTLFEKSLKLSFADQAKTLLVRRLAPLADLYVCDAFAAAHRSQPSLCGFEQVLPSCMGRLFEREYETLSKLMLEPEHPCVFVLGGAKVADAFMMMKAVLESGAADSILTGGVVANILMLSQGKTVGKATERYIHDAGYGDCVGIGKELIQAYSGKILLPVDFAYVSNHGRVEVSSENIDELTPALVDIGQATAAGYADILQKAKTVFVNGPMGVFEKTETAAGTKTVFEAMANSPAHTIVGGGDSITALNAFELKSKINYVCTGGGALIRFISGETLPVVQALRTRGMAAE